MSRTIPFRIQGTTVECHFEASIRGLSSLASRDKTVLVTDENVFGLHRNAFKGWNTIVLKPGEEYKVQATVDTVLDRLIDYRADRGFTLVGVGGGVVTDLTGYAASVYMRGIRFGFVPTTLLSMVDAAIGGKNGVDVGPYKNLVGVIRQPDFLLYDMGFLESLPATQWSNGFAEVVKHACIKDAPSFRTLEAYDLDSIRRDRKRLSELVERNARLKMSIVKRDPTEKGERRLLNFGHTVGHAIETAYELGHGEAVAIGMGIACRLSETHLGFKDTHRVCEVLNRYGLPSEAVFDVDRVIGTMMMDKKRVGKQMNFVMLERIGKGRTVPVQVNALVKQIKAQGGKVERKKRKPVR
jgi:3-dehydroquinate synthase